MKKYRLRESAKNVLAVVAFLSLIVIGVIIVDTRLGQINDNQQKSATEVRTHIAQTN